MRVEGNGKSRSAESKSIWDLRRSRNQCTTTVFSADKKDLPSQLPGNYLEILTSDLFQDSATLALNTPGQDIFDVLHQMKSNNGQRLLFTEQQAWDFTAPSDLGSRRLVLFAVLFIIMNHLLAQIPHFFFKYAWKLRTKMVLAHTYVFIVFLWWTTHPSSVGPLILRCPIDVVCSVNSNNYKSIVKLCGRHQWTHIFVDVKSRWNDIEPNWTFVCDV